MLYQNYIRFFERAGRYGLPDLVNFLIREYNGDGSCAQSVLDILSCVLYHMREVVKMEMTQYESERERLAMIEDLVLMFLDLREEGKDSLSVDEIINQLHQFARSVKIHK